MGLTIHYTVEFDGTKKQLQKKLEKIQQTCRDLPFEEVREVETVRITKDIIKIWNFLQEMITYPNNSIDNMAMRDLIMEKLGVSTWKMVELGEWKQECNARWKVTRPTTMVSLYLWPGEGCESLEFNFQRINGKFVCKSCCKTQYAEQFVKCHLLVIQLLDMLKAEGFDVDVYDEGGFWETRDIKVLAKNINESTALISAVLGGLKSAVADRGIVVEAPIEKSQNYMKVDED
jgi:hypothetical protein